MLSHGLTSSLFIVSRDEVLFFQRPSAREVTQHLSRALMSPRRDLFGEVVENAKLADQSPPRPDEETKIQIEPQSYLDPIVSLHHSFRPSSDGNGSIYSADHENERERGRLSAPFADRYHSISPAPVQSWRVKCSTLWTTNYGLVLVLLAQFFGALMNVTTRLLETSVEPLNTFQVPHVSVRRFKYVGI